MRKVGATAGGWLLHSPIFSTRNRRRSKPGHQGTDDGELRNKPAHAVPLAIGKRSPAPRKGHQDTTQSPGSRFFAWFPVGAVSTKTDKAQSRRSEQDRKWPFPPRRVHHAARKRQAEILDYA